MKFLYIPLTFILFTSITSCSKEKPVTLVMAESNPKGTISSQVDEVFVKRVSELSKGNITIELYTDSTLGDNTAVTEIMSKPGSSIHIARVSPAAISKYNCAKHQLLEVPFTFSSRNHFWNFAESDIAQEFLNEPYEKNVGFKGLFFAEEGFRYFFSTKKLTSIDDFKGEKIRTAGNAVMNGIVYGLKGHAVSVNFSNMYSALKTGVVDIAEQPIANYLSNNFQQVAPNMILDGHQLGLMEVIITTECWDSLSENQQKILIEAGKYAGRFCREISQSVEDKAKNELIAKGAVFTEVNDIAPWQKACADIITESAKEDPTLYLKILELSK